jgi:hypothetical protein
MPQPISADASEGRPLQGASTPAQRRYQRPRLQYLGSVRELTLGSSGGTHDVGITSKKP